MGEILWHYSTTKNTNNLILNYINFFNDAHLI